MKEFDRTNNNGFYNANEPIKALLQTINNTLSGFKVKHPWRMSNPHLLGCVESNAVTDWLVSVQKALVRWDPENQVMKLDLCELSEFLYCVNLADNGEPLAFKSSAYYVTSLLNRKAVDMCYEVLDRTSGIDLAPYDRLYRETICQVWVLVAYMISRTGQVEWLENWRDTKYTVWNDLCIGCKNFLELRNDSQSFARDYMKMFEEV